MPRDGSGNYTLPYPAVVDGTTIESAVHNGTMSDIALQLNGPLPIIAGGTGANNAHDAMINLKGEIAAQVVTNYDTFPFADGDFYSLPGATSAPSAGYVAGICYGTGLGAMMLEARDLSAAPNVLWLRSKVAGTWSAWSQGPASQADADARYVNVTGDVMSGKLTVSINAGTAPTVFAGEVLHAVGVDGSPAGLAVEGYGAGSILRLRTAMGTQAAKTAMISGGGIGIIAGQGYDGAAYAAGFQIAANAAENWTGTARGTFIDIRTTPTGAATHAIGARFYGSGGLSIGGAFTDPGTGGLYVGGATASTSPTTGALTVAGGIGSNVTSGYSLAMTTVGSGRQFGIAVAAGGWLTIDDITGGAPRIRALTSGTVELPTSIPSTSPTTGALTVGGGVGISGALWTTGGIQSAALVVGTNSIKVACTADVVGGRSFSINVSSTTDVATGAVDVVYNGAVATPCPVASVASGGTALASNLSTLSTTSCRIHCITSNTAALTDPVTFQCHVMGA